MQQTFQCYRCSAQNYVGQPACQSCGYQFYYNCPRCNVVVDPQFINCLNCGTLLPWAQSQSEPSLHMLTLDSQNKEPVGFNVSNSALILLPAITTNGRLSTLSVQNQNDFVKLRKDIKTKINQEWKTSRTHVCAAVNYIHPKIPNAKVLIYQVTGSPEFIPEIENMYHSLTGLTRKGNSKGDEYWTRVEEHYGSEPMRSWINELIFTLRRTLNWKETVDQTLASI
jgi:hypothetical protein